MAHPPHASSAMSGTPTRREVISGIGSGIIASGAILFYSGDSKATKIQVDELDIPDEQKTLTNPLNRLRLTVSGSFEVESSNQPDRIVLRVEGKRATYDEFQQLTATDYSSDLSKSYSNTFDLEGNLLELQNVTAPDLSPGTIGETQSIDVDLRIRLVVYGDQGPIKTHTVQDTVSIEITKGEAQVSATINASGSINASSV